MLSAVQFYEDVLGRVHSACAWKKSVLTPLLSRISGSNGVLQYEWEWKRVLSVVPV